MEETEKLKEELETLKREYAKNEESEKLKAEIEILKSNIQKAKFRKNHSKLVGVTGALERGVRRMFKGAGNKLKNAANNLSKNTESPKGNINGALNILD